MQRAYTNADSSIRRVKTPSTTPEGGGPTSLPHIFAKILPLDHDVRWVPSRKAWLVEAVRRGRLTLAEACETYALSREEFASWKAALESGGLRGLRVRSLSRR